MTRWAIPADARGDWMIYLSAWIVQDGNYPDFRTGQEAEFALEFYSDKGLVPSVGDSSEINQALLVSDAEYQIRGEVVAMQDDAWVIDVGMMAFREERPPDWVQRGTKFKGTP